MNRKVTILLIAISTAVLVATIVSSAQQWGALSPLRHYLMMSGVLWCITLSMYLKTANPRDLLHAAIFQVLGLTPFILAECFVLR